MAPLAAPLPQTHLLPRGHQDLKLGSVNNELDYAKRNYIIKMRQGLASENSKHIIFEDGSLNFKYFNVKKGHYWSKEENERLIRGVIKFGATDFKAIKRECFRAEAGGSNWSETEIRLRVCRLLKCYDLSRYEGHRFTCSEEILETASRNKEEALRTKKVCGGILYNPPPEVDTDSLTYSMFNKKNQTPSK
jgi:hypothetical protein